MRISILGGGPAGLYFAILMQQTWPRLEIEVHERNRPDDTFGFGVVFSDQTLETFERYDAESYRAITQKFAYWDDIEIRFKGTVHRIGGNGFCGCARRTLLMLLHERCRALGVKLHFSDDVKSLDAFADADLIVAADGINSFVREQNRAHFRHQRRPAAEPLRLDGFDPAARRLHLLLSRDASTASSSRHAYQYEPGHSTWVMETDVPTYARAGLAAMDEAQSARFLESVFAEDLDGHRLVANRSTWRQFPMIRNAPVGDGQRRAAGRREVDRAFLHRLRHQARDGGCDRAVRAFPQPFECRRCAGEL